MDKTIDNIKERNFIADITKYICAFLVVAIHFSDNLELVALSRIAVPIFFTISGFLLGVCVKNLDTF